MDIVREGEVRTKERSEGGSGRRRLGWSGEGGL